MTALLSSAAGALSGTVTVPGDKSISHRAIMLGGLAVGETRIEGLLEGEDVLATAAALRAFGATVTRHGEGRWSVWGVGVGGLLEPESALDMGNSGTSTRLLMGLAASCPIRTTFVGDASLSSRPMGRVIAPLMQMGAEVQSRGGGRLPLTLTGRTPLLPLRYILPVASAQVKSAILLAGLNTPGITTVIEREPTRDHSERMLRGFGAEVWTETVAEGLAIHIRGEAELRPCDIIVPGDPSSAGFPIVAAAIIPGSEVCVRNVGMNPTRSGLTRVLADMGAQMAFENPRDVGGEPVADLRVTGGLLRAVQTLPDIAASMIDEYPIAFVAAACADGTSRFTGLAELRVKESDRLATMAAGLAACGVRVREGTDWIEIEGSGGAPVPGGATISAKLDHRIAMSFAVLGLHAQNPITIDDRTPIATSFPSFLTMMQGLGAALV
jgi:3-phosphoshikimate 1-carboxyvinyltransferase